MGLDSPAATYLERSRHYFARRPIADPREHRIHVTRRCEPRNGGSTHVRRNAATYHGARSRCTVGAPNRSVSGQLHPPGTTRVNSTLPMTTRDIVQRCKTDFRYVYIFRNTYRKYITYAVRITCILIRHDFSPLESTRVLPLRSSRGTHRQITV